MTSTLHYIHDPMCSWCWGYRPVWDALQQKLPASLPVEYVAGGLAADTNSPMPMELQSAIQGHWKNIQSKLGTEFNFDFWKTNTPRRSTYNACRAAIAANHQGHQVTMIDAIQRAYYLRALNPSDCDVLIGLATELHSQGFSVDEKRFSEDLFSTETQTELERQIRLARQLTHQGFPSLVLECNGQRRSLVVDYMDYSVTLDEIMKTINQ